MREGGREGGRRGTYRSVGVREEVVLLGAEGQFLAVAGFRVLERGGREGGREGWKISLTCCDGCSPSYLPFPPSLPPYLDGGGIKDVQSAVLVGVVDELVQVLEPGVRILELEVTGGREGGREEGREGGKE
jgi:hypothetical protein